MAQDYEDPAERRRNRMREKLNQSKEPKEPSEPQRRRPQPRKKEESSSLFGKRALALGMLAPMLLPIVPVVVQMFSGGFKQFRRTQRYRNMFAVLWLGLFVCLIIKQWRSFARYIGVLLVLICLYPSWQVHECSPRHIMNKDLGTMFSLKLSAEKLMDDAYYNDDCVRRHMRGPTSLSMFRPALTIEISLYDLVNLEEQTPVDEDSSEDAPPPSTKFKRYLFTSKRSVNKVIHVLSLIVEAPASFNSLDDASRVDDDRLATSKLIVTGRMEPLKGDLFQLKKQLQKEQYTVRPMVFVVFKADFVEGDPVPSMQDDDVTTSDGGEGASTTSTDT